jgi:ribosomal protein L11 methyltransferase
MSEDDATVEWLEIEVPVVPAEAADVAGALTTTVAAAQGGVELRADSIVFWVRPADVEASVNDARAALTALSGSGMLVDPAGVRVAAARPEHEWRDAWKRYFRTTRVSERLVIVPSWDTHVPRAGDTILEIDPGRAFGTGAHASTQLCLMEIDALATRSRVHCFLDVGTGSGILAIAAARLWPDASGFAIDTDPEAVEVATENVQRNGVAGRVRCETTPLSEVPETFDLVMANIQADVLTALRDVLVQRLTSGGTLILSGLLSTEVESVGRAYAAVPGHRLIGVRRSAADPEWSCAVVTRV